MLLLRNGMVLGHGITAKASHILNVTGSAHTLRACPADSNRTASEILLMPQVTGWLTIGLVAEMEGPDVREPTGPCCLGCCHCCVHSIIRQG